MNIVGLMVSDYVMEKIESMGDDIYYTCQRVTKEAQVDISKWKLRFWVNFNKKGILVINFLLETGTDKDALFQLEAPIGHWGFGN